MNIKDLTYFNHLAKTLSFTDTAQHFYISQPSISMAIKRLEDELSTTLINRKNNHKKLSLTETGQILLKYSHQILLAIEEAEEEIHDLNYQIVYLGYLPTIGSHFMPQLLPHIEAYSDSLKLIEEESSDVMLDMVKSGEVPLAIIATDLVPINSEDIMQIPLQQEEMSAWVSVTNPLAKKKVLRFSDIAEISCISLEKRYLHERVFQQWIDNNRMAKPQVLYTKEIQTAISVAASTNMVAFLSDIIVPPNAPLIKIPIENPPNLLISLVVNQSRHVNQFQKEFNAIVVNLTKGII